MARMGWRDIKLAVHFGLYGSGLCCMVSDKPRLYLSAPEAGGGPVERSLFSLEVRGQRGGLSERDGTMRGKDTKRYGHHACIWWHSLERLYHGT